jgi:hypothetical protein
MVRYVAHGWGSNVLHAVIRCIQADSIRCRPHVTAPDNIRTFNNEVDKHRPWIVPH